MAFCPSGVGYSARTARSREYDSKHNRDIITTSCNGCGLSWRNGMRNFDALPHPRACMIRMLYATYPTVFPHGRQQSTPVACGKWLSLPNSCRVEYWLAAEQPLISWQWCSLRRLALWFSLLTYELCGVYRAICWRRKTEASQRPDLSRRTFITSRHRKDTAVH